MGTKKFFTLTTHLDFVHTCFIKEFLRGDMVSSVDSFRVFVSKFLLFVFGSVVTYIFRRSGSNHQIDSYCCRDSKIDEFVGEENGFQVPKGDRINESDEVNDNSVFMETSKYEFLSGKHFSGFLEEPKNLVFSVQEFYTGGSSDSTNTDNGIFYTEEEAFHQEKAEDSVENVLIKQEETFTDDEERVFTEYKFMHNYDSLSKVAYNFEDKSLPVDSELDTTDSSDVCDSTESVEAKFEEKVENIESMMAKATFIMDNQTIYSDDDYIELKLESQNSSLLDEDMYSIQDLMEADNKNEEEDLVHKETEPVDHSASISEEPQLHNLCSLDEEILFRENLNEAEDHHEEEDGSVEFEEPSYERKGFISDYDADDDEDDLEFSKEHEDIIEQLRMELRKARTGGLATIMEEAESESQSPKMVEELKPLKIDKKLEHKDRMVEIHKFYKSYLNKMRKLDVLNCQTMHAVGLLQLKEPCQLIKTQKSAVPAIKSLLSQNLWCYKPQRSESNSTLKFIGELHRDFELVYVGQLCLSWEILHWQYRKVFELLEYDCQQLRQYNQVADEFQIFQVLLQRFVENEPFQGHPRVQNYVESRRAYCNLLQVPAIKDDNLKDKKGRGRDEEDTITSAMLTEIIKESIRVFWEFLRADKCEADVTLNSPELQDSIDSELLIDIRTDFQKKEKRLKEILRTGSCIVKKIQKHHEGRLNYAMLFAQVELKLVSRVLNMSKLTRDQLVWCHEKLAKINFLNRKLVLEPSFLLFPF
ncbi:uncharacterized protein LOC116132857 isoform X2 [Pistacia vera]|uniref:uncharacterized protein LOC116132857 isoform X2 n=1 Tax=Pistacia vera TaxID=55513 RepID=UPI001262E81E|nr:uncharacterized protein LOC116132857 isoform X2 [Pistacia vera]